MPISNSIKSPSDLSTSFLGSADETTSSSIKSSKNFAPKAYSFINNKIPTNLELLFKERRIEFGSFVFTSVVGSSGALALATLALSLFSTENVVLAVILSVVTVDVGADSFLNGRRLLTQKRIVL